jgi:Na+-driven multidrug efflux pump
VIKLNKNRDLTTGSITGGLWSFAVPLMLGNVFQQFYNLSDTWMVGKYVGDNALAAVGSSYTLLTFLNSVIIGLEPPYPIRVDSLQCQKTNYIRA